MYADLLFCKELAGLLLLLSLIHYADMMNVLSITQQVGVGITVNDHLSQKTVESKTSLHKTSKLPIRKVK